MKKILLVGNVDGKFEYLFEKIKLLNSKGQTFDALFCVGNTLTFTFQINPYITKEKSFPLPTFFLDASELSFSLNEIHPKGVEICENFTFLGRSGIKDIMGLKIAYLNGIKNESFPNLYQQKEKDLEIFSGCYYTSKDISSISRDYQEMKALDPNAYIDFFFTNEWPLGFENGLVEFPKMITNTSIYVSNLANLLCPRYHIVSLENIHYERLPYLNQIKTLTRLIALAGVPDKDNKSFKEKYLMALQVTPASQMEKGVLADNSDKAATANPYDINKFNLRETSKEGDLEDENRKREEEIKKINEMTENSRLFVKGFDYRTRDDEIYEFLSRLGPVESLEMVYDPYTKKPKGFGFFKFSNIKDMKKALLETNKYTLNGRKIFFGLETPNHKTKNYDCWFCLSNEKTDKSLIFYISSEVYLSLDKGPIVPKHIQIIPIDHYDKSIALPSNVSSEIKMIKDKLRNIFNLSYNQNLIFYERVVKLKNNTSHMVLHSVPMSNSQTESFIEGFEMIAKKNKLNFFKIKENEDLNNFCGENDLYVYLEISQEKYTHKYVCTYNERDQAFAANDVLREIICEILKLNHRLRWKDCLMTESEKNSIISEMKNKLNQKI